MHRFRGYTRAPGEFRRWLPAGYRETATDRFEAGLPVADLDARRTLRVVAEPPCFSLPAAALPAGTGGFLPDVPVSSGPPRVLLNDA